MQSRYVGAGIAVVGVIVAVVLFVVLSGGDDNADTDAATVAQTTTAEAGPGVDSGGQAGGGGQSEGGGEAQVPTIVVEGGQPVDGVQELAFSKGDDIRFRVKSDVADEVHLHGYDVMEDVPAGGQVEFDVPATIDGVFEVELEQRVVPLAEITVQP